MFLVMLKHCYRVELISLPVVDWITMSQEKNKVLKFLKKIALVVDQVATNEAVEGTSL